MTPPINVQPDVDIDPLDKLRAMFAPHEWLDACMPQPDVARSPFEPGAADVMNIQRPVRAQPCRDGGKSLLPQVRS
jgi:hypothetical protein